ncbi:hypothetical protein HDV00_008533 [Rhizophlyctis rosea]|nr:hypothetical protein HDV00_008533 [Rhizophlyctis rosea]
MQTVIKVFDTFQLKSAILQKVAELQRIKQSAVPGETITGRELEDLFSSLDTNTVDRLKVKKWPTVAKAAHDMIRILHANVEKLEKELKGVDEGALMRDIQGRIEKYFAFIKEGKAMDIGTGQIHNWNPTTITLHPTSTPRTPRQTYTHTFDDPYIAKDSTTTLRKTVMQLSQRKAHMANWRRAESLSGGESAGMGGGEVGRRENVEAMDGGMFGRGNSGGISFVDDLVLDELYHKGPVENLVACCVHVAYILEITKVEDHFEWEDELARGCSKARDVGFSNPGVTVVRRGRTDREAQSASAVKTSHRYDSNPDEGMEVDSNVGTGSGSGSGVGSDKETETDEGAECAAVREEALQRGVARKLYSKRFIASGTYTTSSPFAYRDLSEGQIDYASPATIYQVPETTPFARAADKRVLDDKMVDFNVGDAESSSDYHREEEMLRKKRDHAAAAKKMILDDERDRHVSMARVPKKTHLHFFECFS